MLRRTSTLYECSQMWSLISRQVSQCSSINTGTFLILQMKRKLRVFI